MDEGAILKEAPIREADWAWEIQFPKQPFRLIAMNPIGKEDLVVIMANQEIAPKLVEKLEGLPDPAYKAFETDLRLDLNKRPPETGFVQNEKRRVWRIQHSVPIREDGLTADYLARSVRHILRNLYHVELWLVKAFGAPPSEIKAFPMRPKSDLNLDF